MRATGASHDGYDEERKPSDGTARQGQAKATAATEAAKDAAAKGQAKYDEVQAKKAADGLLRDLGAAVYATKSGRATPSTDCEIERLVTALQSYESEHGRSRWRPSRPRPRRRRPPTGGGSTASDRLRPRRRPTRVRAATPATADTP